MDFASSGYARDFFQGQVPQIIRSLKSIADSQQKLVELQMQNSTSKTACESRVHQALLQFLFVMKKTVLSCLMRPGRLIICL